jgi:glycosidase
MLQRLANKQEFILILLVLFLSLMGCTNTRNESEEFETSTGKLTLTVYLDNIITNNISSALAVEDQVDLSEVELSLTNVENPNLNHQEQRDITADQTEISFKLDDLNVDDNYDVKVKFKDDKGNYVYQGTDQVLITSAESNASVDELRFMKVKDVIINLNNLPEEADSGQVSLKTNDASTYTQDIEIDSKTETATVDFSDDNVEVGEYDLSLTLFSNEQEIFSNQKSDVVVLPNQVTTINLDCKNGSGGLGISVLWEAAPESPTDFATTVIGETRVQLEWDQGEENHTIYRNQSNDFASATKLATGIEKNKYIDQQLADDTEYYYWIQAMSESGVSSQVVGPRKASIPQFSGVEINYYQKSNQQPTIFVETKTGTDIIEDMGYDKQESIPMKQVENAPSGWYSFKIADKYLPAAKDSVVVKFNQAKQEVELDPVKTAWYKGGEWAYKAPYKSRKPEIAVNPAGGMQVGEQPIIIKISGANITTSKAEFAGEEINLEENLETKIILKDYLKNVGKTGTLNLSATNDAGTTEKSIDFTRVNPSAESRVDSFSWASATAYYVILDRFYNAKQSNDNSYGRPQVDQTGSQIGTFHGGDIVGVTEKIKDGYFNRLGINTLCITAPYEQIHGFVGGGPEGSFARYAYDGQHALDYTTLDKNVGTVAEFREFVNTAHQHGIRVVMDIVFNNPGDNTIKDMKQYNFGNWVDRAVTDNWSPAEQGNWYQYQNSIDYTSGKAKWANWWGPNWIRDDLPGYEATANKQLTKFLPDFKTELTTDQGLPPVLETKWSQEGDDYQDWINPSAAKLRKDLGLAPADYLIKWLTAWVEEFGIDGFKAYNLPAVAKDRWGQLAGAGQQSLEKWRANNPKLPGAQWKQEFLMIGQVEGQGLQQNDYYEDNNGDAKPDFTALMNNNFPVASDFDQLGQIWSDYAIRINGSDNFNVVSYISSLDRGLKEREDKISAGTKLLLSPGLVQVLYGEEVNRKPSSQNGNLRQRISSDYPWDNREQEVLEHWQKLGQFRAEHPAVGAGEQIQLAPNTYARTWDQTADGNLDDKVIIKVATNGQQTIDVGDIFADGTTVRNFYTGNTEIVQQGTVEFVAKNSVILIEELASNIR